MLSDRVRSSRRCVLVFCRHRSTPAATTTHITAPWSLRWAIGCGCGC
jgi:hypothetical protein